MWPVHPDYAETVRSSHGLAVTCDVYRGGVRLNKEPVPVEGTITVDTGQKARRSCSLVLPAFLRTGAYDAVPTLPEATYDTAVPLLGTSGHELRITHHLITSSGGRLSVPVGRFRVDTMSGSELGTSDVSLSGESRESYVIDDVFHSTRVVQGPSTTGLIVTLIRETLPQAVVTITATGDAPVEPTSEDSDRWGLIERLAAQIGAIVYAAPDGRFVIEDAPTLSTPPVWTFAPGQTRSLVEAHRTDSRADVRNDIWVLGATPDGKSAPVTGHARDDNPESPTRHGDPDAGRWGKAPLVLRMSGLTSGSQCQRVAAVELARRTGTASGLDLSAVPHAGLEGWDVVDVAVGRVGSPRPPMVRRHVLTAFDLPLSPGGAFPVTTRDLRAVVLDLEDAA